MNGEVCSGQGTCECGKCECNPGYNNSVLMACDCSNIDCPRRGGMLCNGECLFKHNPFNHFVLKTSLYKGLISAIRSI